MIQKQNHQRKGGHIAVETGGRLRLLTQILQEREERVVHAPARHQSRRKRSPRFDCVSKCKRYDENEKKANRQIINIYLKR